MFLLAAMLQGASPLPPCPVSVQKITVSASVEAFHPTELHVRLQNMGEKAIKSARFQVIYVDETDDSEHPAFANFNNAHQIPPHKDISETWIDPLTRGGARGGVDRVRLLGVLFTDGTTWEPRTIKSCVQSFPK